MKDKILKKNLPVIIVSTLVLVLGIVGLTLALTNGMSSNVVIDTANLGVEYSGNLTLPSTNLFPIEDSEIDTNTENVLTVNFTVKGVQSNPTDIPIIYDIVLSDLDVPEELKSEYLKWQLKKNGIVISTGSFSKDFDTIKGGRLTLTEIQQDLPSYNSTADSYEFKLWISESCPGSDMSQCGPEQDQSNMLNKTLSGKIEAILYTKSKQALVRVPDISAAETITSLLSSNPTTMNNDDPDGNIRYMGADPNNYVSFNNELWRIIGVFDVKSSENGQPEKRLKIIRNESLGVMIYDSDFHSDWSRASLQEYLNGEYYNIIESTSQALIGDTYWNLGGTATYDSSSNGLASHWYGYERGTKVYDGYPTYWVGKIGIMYPSDYGYATSGGTTTNRESCLAKELGINGWGNSSYSDCKNNDYLYDSSLYQWTITPKIDSSDAIFYVTSSGYIYYKYASDYSGLRPVLYLKSDVTITGGDGTSVNPFILQ